MIKLISFDNLLKNGESLIGEDFDRVFDVIKNNEENLIKISEDGEVFYFQSEKEPQVTEYLLQKVGVSFSKYIKLEEYLNFFDYDGYFKQISFIGNISQQEGIKLLSKNLKQHVEEIWNAEEIGVKITELIKKYTIILVKEKIKKLEADIIEVKNDLNNGEYDNFEWS